MRLTLALVLLSACGGGRSQIAIGPPPDRATKGVLSGPLCANGECKCGNSYDEIGEADAGKKRFEFRLDSAQELWVTLPGHVLYKSPERAETCFYVDLLPGVHDVALRAMNKDGVSAQMEIFELGAKAKTKYNTFRFSCGHPGVCSFEDLDNAKVSYKDFKRGLHDPCGSTKIKGISWDHGKAPDGTHPDNLLVRLQLDVYKFLPEKPSGDATCGAGEGGRANEPAPE